MTTLLTTCTCGATTTTRETTLARAATEQQHAGWSVSAISAGRIAGDRWDASATGRCPDCVSGAKRRAA